jgi:hypothetical protein
MPPDRILNVPVTDGEAKSYCKRDPAKVHTGVRREGEETKAAIWRHASKDVVTRRFCLLREWQAWTRGQNFAKRLAAKSSLANGKSPSPTGIHKHVDSASMLH